MKRLVELIITEQNSTFIGWLIILSIVIFWGLWIFLSVRSIVKKNSTRSDRITGSVMLGFAIFLVFFLIQEMNE